MVLRLILPLTYLRPIYEGWILFGDPISWRETEVIALILHAAFGLVILFVALSFRQKRL